MMKIVADLKDEYFEKIKNEAQILGIDFNKALNTVVKSGLENKKRTIIESLPEDVYQTISNFCFKKYGKRDIDKIYNIINVYFPIFLKRELGIDLYKIPKQRPKPALKRLLRWGLIKCPFCGYLHNLRATTKNYRGDFIAYCPDGVRFIFEGTKYLNLENYIPVNEGTYIDESNIVTGKPQIEYNLKMRRFARNNIVCPFCKNTHKLFSFGLKGVKFYCKEYNIVIFIYNKNLLMQLLLDENKILLG